MCVYERVCRTWEELVLAVAGGVTVSRVVWDRWKCEWLGGECGGARY